MINNMDFANRLNKVMDYYQLSAAAFADKINVQRSSISHLLSGRNKPSLDFVLKLLDEFKEVELYWLLNGKGNFPKWSHRIPCHNHFSLQLISRLVILSRLGRFGSDRWYPNPDGHQDQSAVQVLPNQTNLLPPWSK